MSDAAARLRDEVRRVIEESGVVLPSDFDDHTSLIRSALLDSLALFQVVVWLEDRLGPEFDLTAFDVAEELDSVAKVLAFIERHGRKPV
jgi:acyl carrier protein